MIPDPIKNPEAYRVLLGRSVRQLEPGDLVEHAGAMVQVVDVRNKPGVGRVVSFGNAAPDMLLDSARWAGVEVTVYRPRAGF